MEKKVLYRKYRPQDFNTVVGQKHIIKTLINEINTSTTVHAYIFSGPKGSGKTSIAKIFSKAINCLNLKDSNPCNECKNCLEINNNSSIDFIELDGASNSGVNEIRSLIDSIEYAPSQLKYKVYIIDEAHMLTNNSWNALLKSIEEPPNNVIFIFATTEYNKIPPTIVSRSERFDFNKISDIELKQLLLKVAEQERIKIHSNALDNIVSLADGAARDALSILEQMRSFSSNDIKENDLNEMFGLVSLDDKIKFIELLLANDVQNVLLYIKSFSEQGINFYNLLIELIEILMDIYIYQTTKNLSLLKRLHNERIIETINYDARIISLIDILNINLNQIKNSDKPHFEFEFLILKVLDTLQNNLNQISNINIKLNSNNNEENAMSSNTKNMNVWRKSQSTEPFDGPSIKLDSIGEIDEEQTETVPIVTKDMFRTKEMQARKESVTRKLTATIPLEQKWDIDKTPAKTNDEPIDEREGVNRSAWYLNDEEVKEAFFSVAYNHDSNIKETNNKILQEVLENSDLEMSPIINKFLKIKKFLISSPNGSFILMDNKFLCDEFNKISLEKEFLDYYKENFSKVQRVIAIDKETAKNYLDEYKKLNQQSFKDVKIFTSDDDKEQITKSLLNILNS